MKYPAICEHHLYNKAYKQGKHFFGKYVCVYVLKDRMAKKLQRSHPERIIVNRLGLSVSKKIGGAVERNRAKRVIRAGYATVEQRLKRGYLIVISARPDICGCKSQDIARELRFAFKKTEMIDTGASAPPSNKV